MTAQTYTQYLNQTPIIRRLVVPCLFILSFIIPYFKDTLGPDTASKMQILLSCFLLLLIWNLLADSYSDPSTRFFCSAEDGQQWFLENIKTCKHKCNAILIQHSLNYAKDMIRELVRVKSINNIDIYIQHPEMAITETEAIKIVAAIYDFEHNKENYKKNINLYFYKTPPNVRGCLVEGICAIAGWYIFTKPALNVENKSAAKAQIYGHDTPSVVMRSDSKDFLGLSSFLERTSVGLRHNSTHSEHDKGKLLVNDILSNKYKYRAVEPSPYV